MPQVKFLNYTVHHNRVYPDRDFIALIEFVLSIFFYHFPKANKLTSTSRNQNHAREESNAFLLYGVPITEFLHFSLKILKLKTLILPVVLHGSVKWPLMLRVSASVVSG